ncbi:unnamed protein product (macronuclear) [Paramecium tetraurelia]|uniref:Uncharacterized protein n=1 Tax=Paramecium tetraurelia TaxID=5888 RepID=A0CR24_PARTE|nr:uncharacterized protein GSPATT00009554001 [Paramecium tetraurelia]CAK73241.1 unnamed protein product [Paramecium tetraurelia]|eukprot:XP_001440638.1 hypothetical protein (macronuclear) [Paramecium tetraurelia strain d4-2]
MSRFNYVFKPLSIDTFEYSYMDGKTEKSFTIKRKTSLKEGKSVMQRSEPITQFNNETIKQSQKRAQTSRRMKQSPKPRSQSINSNTPKIAIRKIESRLEDELEITDIRNSIQKRSINIPQMNYLNFNIAIMSGQTSSSFPKAQELINKDNKLLRKKTLDNSKALKTIENEIQQYERLENYHPLNIKEHIGRMLAINEKRTPIRQRNKDREAFTRNLQFLEESLQQSTAPEKKLQTVIQQYFLKKKSFQEEKAKQEEIQQTKLQEETIKININKGNMRMSTTFLKRFIHQVEKDKQQKFQVQQSIEDQLQTSEQQQEQTSEQQQQEQTNGQQQQEKTYEQQQLQQQQSQQIETQKSYMYSIKSSQINKKRQNAIYSGQVRTIFKRMFHLILDCVKKMKQMKLTIKELFQHGVIQKKPYERQGSFQFFEAVENNSHGLITFMLQKCRYYAFDINEEGQTPLHISSILGYYETTERLLQCGSYPDSYDFKGLPPLYYAIQQQHREIVKLLLFYNANPWSNSKYKLETQNNEIRSLLKQSRKIHLLLLLTKHSDRDQIWINSRKSLLS